MGVERLVEPTALHGLATRAEILSFCDCSNRPEKRRTALTDVVRAVRKTQDAEGLRQTLLQVLSQRREELLGGQVALVGPDQ